MARTNVKVGDVCNVHAQDCCVTVHFVSKVVEIRFDVSDQEGDYPTFYFENGVVIEGDVVKVSVETVAGDRKHE